jgi:hypothetical protein
MKLEDIEIKKYIKFYLVKKNLDIPKALNLIQTYIFEKTNKVVEFSSININLTQQLLMFVCNYYCIKFNALIIKSKTEEILDIRFEHELFFNG